MIVFLYLTCYITIGIIALHIQAKPEQDYIDNWLAQAPHPFYRAYAYVWWPIVLIAAVVNAPSEPDIAIQEPAEALNAEKDQIAKA